MKSSYPIFARFCAAVPALATAAVLSFPCLTALAAPVSPEQAAAAVTGWLSLDQTPLGESLGTSVQRVDTFSDKAGNSLYHVACLDPAGFVIVAADDLVEPIIGFAQAGRFDPAEDNPLGALVSRDLANRIADARKAGAVPADAKAAQAQTKWQQLCPKDGGPVARPKGLTSISDVRVAPLTQTTWSQKTAADAGTSACYNYYTPPNGDGNTGNYPAGCVATALAQFMRYHRFPATGVGYTPFTVYSDGTPLTYYLHGGDGSGGAYVWDNMPLMPPANPTTAQCQAIGALIADAGATVNMSYAASGSESSMSDGRNALVNTFLFANARYGWNDNNEVGAGLTAMINPNLDAHYPVLLSVEGSVGGHAVIADGYGYNLSTLYHHLNLGWSGSATAWYALPLLDTGSYTFTVVDGSVYNVYTNGSGEIISGRVLDQISRPVVNASVTATRTGGGTYSTTTDSQGIYALARIPSASSYSITVSKANYSSATSSFSTGTSTDRSATSGNYWGADFTLNMLPTVVDHLVWGTIAATQNLNAPFGVTITAQNATNGVVGGFTGPVALNAYMTGLGAGGTFIGNLDWTAARSSASGLTHGYAFTPNTNIQVTAVRSYSGDKVSIWTDTGTLLASRAISSSESWAEAVLTTPVLLSAGTTYRVTGHYGANVWGYYTTPWPTTFAHGSVGQAMFTAYGDAFPAQVFTNAQGPLVDLRYQVAYSNSIAISPTTSGSFVGGVWNGNITVALASTNVVLRANDGAGHVALSTPFNVIDPNAGPPSITTDPQSRTNNVGENATFSLVASGNPSPGYVWRRNGSPIGGATLSSYTLNDVKLSDSGSQFNCVVSNSHGAITSQTAVLTVVNTNLLLAAQPAVTLNSGAAVYAIAPLPDGSVIFAGYFTTVNNVARNGLAKLQPNGALDLTWSPIPNSSTFAMAVSGTNLYIGGAFTGIGSYGRNYIAKLRTTGTGAVDPTWNPGANDWVQTIVANGSEMYVGGYFTSIGLQNRGCIAKLSAEGTGLADATWNPNATYSGNTPVVNAIAVSGANVYAGGDFTSIGGQSRNRLAKLSATGAGLADATWNPNPNWTVYSLAASGSSVFAAGGFGYVGGQYRTGIAKLSASGTGAADATWNPNADNGVWSVAVNGLCVYAGGAFSSLGGSSRARLAKLSALGTGAADSAWQADCDGDVQVIVPGSTAVYIGGGFTQVAGETRVGLAALNSTPLRLLSPQRLGGGQFQFTLSGERGQGFDILASTNLQSWATIATLTNTTGTTNFTDPTTGLKGRFYRARQMAAP